MNGDVSLLWGKKFSFQLLLWHGFQHISILRPYRGCGNFNYILWFHIKAFFSTDALVFAPHWIELFHIQSEGMNWKLMIMQWTFCASRSIRYCTNVWLSGVGRNGEFPLLLTLTHCSSLCGVSWFLRPELSKLVDIRKSIKISNIKASLVTEMRLLLMTAFSTFRWHISRGQSWLGSCISLFHRACKYAWEEFWISSISAPCVADG